MGLWDDLTGKTAADAANAAAKDTYAKQQMAIGGLNNYSDTLPGQYNALGAGYDPYRQAGTGALSMMMNPQAFTEAYHNMPGYQAALDTGNTALMRQLNAGNAGQSGAALKAAERYGVNFENQQSDSFWNKLMGLSGQGLQATGAQAGLGAQGLGAQAGLRGSAFGGQMNAAGTIGQGQVAGAQAQQQGVQGLLNAGTNLLGGGLGGGYKAPWTIPLPNQFSPLPYGRA